MKKRSHRPLTTKGVIVTSEKWIVEGRTKRCLACGVRLSANATASLTRHEQECRLWPPSPPPTPPTPHEDLVRLRSGDCSDCGAISNLDPTVRLCPLHRAVPVLLEVLERTSGALAGVLAAIERDAGRGPDVVYDVLDEARKAIAKARVACEGK